MKSRFDASGSDQAHHRREMEVYRILEHKTTPSAGC